METTYMEEELQIKRVLVASRETTEERIQRKRSTFIIKIGEIESEPLNWKKIRSFTALGS